MLHLAWDALFGMMPPMVSYSLFFCFIGAQSTKMASTNTTEWAALLQSLDLLLRKSGKYAVVMTPAVFLPHFAYFERCAFMARSIRLPLALEYDIFAKAVSVGIWNVQVPDGTESLAEMVWRLTGGSQQLVSRAVAYLTKAITEFDNAWADLEDQEDARPEQMSDEQLCEKLN